MILKVFLNLKNKKNRLWVLRMSIYNKAKNKKGIKKNKVVERISIGLCVSLVDLPLRRFLVCVLKHNLLDFEGEKIKKITFDFFVKYQWRNDFTQT